MELKWDAEADALYIELDSRPYHHGTDLDDQRRIDYASDGTPVGIEILSVSDGVNVGGLPQHREIARLLEVAGVTTYMLERGGFVGTGYSGPVTNLNIAWPQEARNVFQPVRYGSACLFRFASQPERPEPKSPEGEKEVTV